jgi:serine/threonine protein kinase
LVDLNHPCILRLLGFVLPSKSDPPEIHLEWARNGSLADVLKLVKSGRPPSFWNPTGVAILVCGIMLGMRYMHLRGYIHQDLNPSNILVNEEGHALIADFGSSRPQVADVTPTSSGSGDYSAPEFVQDGDWTKKVDVYSFGVLMTEIVLVSPFFRDDPEALEVFRHLNVCDPSTIESRPLRLMVTFIRMCCVVNPKRRPSFPLLLRIMWIFEMLPGADGGAVSEYIMGVTDWEMGHSDPGNSDCRELTVF